MYTDAPFGIVPVPLPCITTIMDHLDKIDSSIATDSDLLAVPSPASTGTGTSSLTTAHHEEVTHVATAPPVDVLQHPVTTATMEYFDGEAFNIDGICYLLKDIKVDHLRKFCVKNGVKSTQPPHKSVRTATKKIVVEEIKVP